MRGTETGRPGDLDDVARTLDRSSIPCAAVACLQAQSRRCCWSWSWCGALLRFQLL